MRRDRRPPRAAVPAVTLTVVLLGALLAACSGSTSPGRTDRASTTAAARATAPGDTTAAPRAHLRWRDCGDGDLQCATLAVPLDHAHPAGAPDIHLALYRHRAESSHRIGSLLVNPGGPGASARPLVEDAHDLFPREVRDRFDIVGWDPRGAGASTAVQCGRQLDSFFAVDRSPDTPAEVQANVAAAKALARECEQHSASLLAHVSTTDTIVDMDDIRAALGDRRLTYLGFSYGTYLGARYAVAYPTHVRAMVLDGAVDPTLDPATATLQQSEGFESSLDAFLADCSQRRACAFHSGGHAQGALQQLLAQIDAEPLPARVDSESRTLGPGEATIGIASALYSGRSGWPDLATALASAARGDGAPLLKLSDVYTERQPDDTYTNSQAAYYAISCADGQGDGSLAAVEADARAAARVAPVIGPTNAWLGLPCVYWPAPVTAHAGALTAPATLPPVVVITSTRDPATPERWGIALAAQLHGRVVTVDTDTHTAYVGAGPCVQGPVDDYLLTERPPPASGTRCTATG